MSWFCPNFAPILSKKGVPWSKFFLTEDSSLCRDCLILLCWYLLTKLQLKNKLSWVWLGGGWVGCWPTNCTMLSSCRVTQRYICLKRHYIQYLWIGLRLTKQVMIKTVLDDNITYVKDYETYNRSERKQVFAKWRQPQKLRRPQKWRRPQK